MAVLGVICDWLNTAFFPKRRKIYAATCTSVQMADNHSIHIRHLGDAKNRVLAVAACIGQINLQALEDE
jgi:hypothetical protein